MLSPYRVLDLTDHRGELAAMLLGDLGADVIRVEPPGGVEARRQGTLLKAERAPEDMRSLQFLAFNRNKRSIVLDLARQTDRDAFEALIAGRTSSSNRDPTATLRGTASISRAPLPSIRASCTCSSRRGVATVRRRIESRPI